MSSRSGIKSYRVSFDFYVTPGIKFLLIANFAVFIVEALLYHFAGPFAYEELVKWFGLVPAGVIFGILVACAILFPDRRVYLFPFPVAMSMRTIVILMTILTFLGTFGLGADNVSHLCHLGGLLVGYVYLRRGSFLYSLRNSVSDWQNRRNRRRFQIYMGKHRKDPPSRPDNWVN